VAFYTAKSITEPLTHLITVAREIGDSGDLDQNIDIHRNDEIGALATTFNNMVAYLKEMAGVSMAVAEGDLSVEVVPRSKRDTLGNAFLRMSHGLQELVRHHARLRQPGFRGIQPSCRSRRRIRQGERAGVFRDRRSHQHHARDEHQRAERGQKYASAGFQRRGNFRFDRPDGTSINRVADTAKVLLDIANRSREEVVNGISTMEKATDGLNRTNHAIQSSAENHQRFGPPRRRHRENY